MSATTAAPFDSGAFPAPALPGACDVTLKMQLITFEVVEQSSLTFPD